VAKRRKTDSPLRNLRRSRTISQEDLARMAGITQESLSKAERGILRLSPDVQELIATILGGSRDALFPSAQERGAA
jgi:Predicted transcriptional regulator with C-terminal CBS domains